MFLCFFLTVVYFWTKKRSGRPSGSSKNKTEKPTSDLKKSDAIVIGNSQSRGNESVEYILDKGARLIILSHLGRPDENNVVQEEFSLKPVVSYLEQKFQRPIYLTDNLDSLEAIKGQFMAVENIRFFKGEKGNDSNLAKKLGSLCDIFVFCMSILMT